MEREKDRSNHKQVYTPQLRSDLVSGLWRLKQATGRPMTRLMAEAVERYLADQGDVVAAQKGGRRDAERA